MLDSVTDPCDACEIILKPVATFKKNFAQTAARPTVRQIQEKGHRLSGIANLPEWGDA